MRNVGARCAFLKASPELKTKLLDAGQRERFPAEAIVFREAAENHGVYLILRGTVRMGVDAMPRLDRMLTAGSLLGLPSTFTTHPYSLTATTLSEAELLHVSQQDFLEMMRQNPELCRQATEMLGREVTFIQGALAERKRQSAAKKMSSEALLVS